MLTEPERMADEIARVCGPAEADGYRRFVAFASDLWRLERDDFIARNLDSPLDLVRPNLARLVLRGGFRTLSRKIGEYFKDPRTQRIFSFQALYAGVAPQHALAIYAVISYLDSVAGVYFPRGGMHAVPMALAAAAAKHGVTIRYDTTVTRVETYAGRARAVHTAAGERIPADVVVLNPDLPVAYRDLMPAVRTRPGWPGCGTHRPAWCCMSGSSRAYSKIAHHNLHFGRAWSRTFDEVIRQGRLMSDPSLLVTNPTRTDPNLAPDGAAGLLRARARAEPDAGGPDAQAWRERLAERYAAELIATLEARGYVGFGDGVQVRASSPRRTGRRPATPPGRRSPRPTRSGRPDRSGPATCTRHCPTWSSPGRAPSPVSACRWCCSPASWPPSGWSAHERPGSWSWSSSCRRRAWAAARRRWWTPTPRRGSCTGPSRCCSSTAPAAPCCSSGRR